MVRVSRANGYPRPLSIPPHHRPPEECVRVSEEDLVFGLRGEGEAADKTDVPDVPVSKKWPGLSRGGSVSTKILSKLGPGRVGDAVGVMAGSSSSLSLLSSSSSLLSSSVRRALKAPPMTWGMGEGARGDHRERDASLWEG